MSTRAATAAAAAAVAGSGAGPGIGVGGTGAGVESDVVDVVMGGTSTSTSTTSTSTASPLTSPTRPATRATTSSARAAAAAAASKPKGSTIVSASLLATVGRDRRVDQHQQAPHVPRSLAGSGANGGLLGDRGLEPRSRCAQCGRRRTACHHPDPSTSTSSSGGASASSATPQAGAQAAVAGASGGSLLHPRPRRLSKLKHRAAAALSAVGSSASLDHVEQQHHNSLHHHQQPDAGTTPSVAFSIPSDPPRRTSSSTSPSGASTDSSTADAMEPPVLSFYGKEPVPLPSRFGHIKRSLVAGHEAELEASWARLIHALRDDVEDIAARGSSCTPTINFEDMNNPEARAAFSRDLKRYGLGLIRGVVPRADAQAAIDETVKYLEKQTDFKPPSPQDPTCFDFFWTPAQVRTRAHPRVLEAQRFVMSMWDQNAEDKMATRFPIAYADRLRIHGADIGSVGPESAANKAKETESKKEAQCGDKRPHPDDEDEEIEEDDPTKAAAELLGEFTSSTVIAQVDNGSLERWEPDGYGRGGTYDAVFRGEWEKYDPWDPTHRVSATQDLYNGYGVCSIFRMYQGMVALSTIEPGLIRLLPSPKLATAYFLLRPFFSPKTRAPERREGPEWDAFLDPSNWALDKEQNTIIHGAVPGHAQRLTELWHPHLHLRRTLVTIPTLQTGDYVVWHPDLAYHITSNPNVMASRAPSPPPPGEDADASPPGKPVSILVYIPAAPLTQNNALYLARQRKTFLRGHPSPDFDWTGSGLGSEATHIGRPTETYIAEVGGPAALQAMGLAPFDVAPTPPATSSGSGAEKDGDVEMAGTATENASTAAAAGEQTSSAPAASAQSSMTRAEAEVARLANIILFPDRYDFYMPKRTHSSHHGYGYGHGHGHGSSGSGGGNSGGASSSNNGSSSSNNSNKRTKVRVDKLLNPVDEEVGYGKGKAKAEPR
ncbi:hypothetical protein VTJ04DRAFT_2042 [Mycothermus thermophilus]|uniref:uncharacterized protein n=1 Tax=Humicola insolens TaxID=85995 RepID=UPI003743358E